MVDLQKGVRLGPYEIEARLGAGGMGEVYRARDTRLARTVAIKILPSVFAADAKLRLRFEQEARSVSSLSHPHICALYDIGQQDDIQYLVMEYCDGPTLAERIASGRLPLEQGLRYGIQLADALEKAHSTGVLHRDLKPGNIVITKSGVKLLDFGLAAALSESEPAASSTAVQMPRLTEDGQVVGTAPYMAPEVLKGGRADQRSDVFALGAVLYEVLTGRRAFDAPDRASLTVQILEREPLPLLDLVPAVPSAVDRVVRSCLAKDPDARTQSAHDLKLQLQWILDGFSQPARLTEPKRKWSLAIPIGIATLLALAAGLIVLFRSTEKPTRGTAQAQTLRTTIDLHDAAPLGVGTFVPAIGFFSPLVAISHDGTQIVYVGAREGETQLYRRRVGSFGIEAVPGTAGAEHAFFSPDDRWIGFLAGNQVMKVAAAGGAPVKLADVDTPIRGVWRENQFIYVIDGQGREIIEVPADGGVPKKVRSRNLGFSDVFSGGRYALGRGGINASGDFTRIVVVDLQADKATELSERGFDARFVAPDRLLFARGGDLLTAPFDPKERKITGEPLLVQSGVSMESFFGTAQFAVSDTGTIAFLPGGDASVGRLAWIDADGKAASVDMPSSLYGVFSLSADDRRIAMEVSDTTDWIGIFDFDRGEMRRLALSGHARNPDWLADGRLVFTLFKPDKPLSDVVTADWRGQALRILYSESFESVMLVASSQDARTLVTSHRTTAMIRSYVVDTDGRIPPRPVEGGATAAISPDGNWVAYTSQTSGRREVWVGPVSEPSNAYQISPNGGHEPRWCRRCSELFYRKGTRWYSVDVPAARPDQWSSPRLRWETEFVDTRGRSYDVSADGKRLLVSKRTTPAINDRIHLIQNWRGATAQ